MGRTKKNVQRTSVSSDESVANVDKLDEILAKLAGLDSITSKLTNMESMLSTMQKENMMLKQTISKQDTMITELKERVNSLEQHGRSFSVRVNNLPLDANEERDPPTVIKKVYNAVFLPILQGAAAQQAISSVPSCFEMI
jgi:protein subunit release factor A